MSKKILFCHLLNNYTGSPKVLAEELNLLSKNTNYDISLLTSKTDGILSELQNVHFYYNGYHWSNNKFVLIFLFLIAQIRSFFFVLFHKFDIIYINTIVPFGAALAAKIRKAKVIYHIHEVYINTNFMKRFYKKVANLCADRVICVSNYVKENNKELEGRSCVIYNPVKNHEIYEDLNTYIKKKYDKRLVFLPASLKEFKGVNQFVELARKNPDLNFKLLCSTTLREMERFFSGIQLPKNLELVEQKKDLFDFYKEATITINLSLPDKCIETFGLTLVESFDTFTPVLAPAYGGPKEIVEDGKNGFLVNPYDLDNISNILHNITSDFDMYEKISLEAKKTLIKFDIDQFITRIKEELMGEKTD